MLVKYLNSLLKSSSVNNPLLKSSLHKILIILRSRSNHVLSLIPDSPRTCAPEKAVVERIPVTAWNTRSSHTCSTCRRFSSSSVTLHLIVHLPSTGYQLNQRKRQKLRTMARGDECKTASKANYACKSFDVSAPAK